MSESYDLAKAGFDAALAPVTGLIEKIAGPAAEEFGLSLRDSVSVYRMRRQVRLLQKTQEIIKELGGEAQRVPLKLLLPIVEQGSNEEDDELQDRWAALLANSAMDGSSIPAAPDILRQLTKEDVLLLQMCYDFLHKLLVEASSHQHFLHDPWGRDLRTVVEEWKHLIEAKFGHRYPPSGRYGPQPVWGLTLGNLTRLGLISPSNEMPYTMTELGYYFVALCQTTT